MKWSAAALGSSVLVSAVLASSVAFASGMDAKQIQIVAKVFNFLEKKPQPKVTILVMPGAADLDAVKSALGALTVVEGGVANVSGAYAVFVNSAADAQAATASNSSIITISSDVGCVDSGACVIAIETQPKVSIYASRAAATKAGVGFDANFKMLITER